MGLTREQVLLEYAKCVKNPEYALKTYLKTYDQTVQGFVPLKLFPDQVKLIQDFEEFEENIALKYRQAGVSTVTAGWISKKLITAPKGKPEKILIIANKLDTAVGMADKIRSFQEQWPDEYKNALARGKARMLQLESIRQDELTLADILLERKSAFEWYQSINC